MILGATCTLTHIIIAIRYSNPLPSACPRRAEACRVLSSTSAVHLRAGHTLHTHTPTHTHAPHARLGSASIRIRIVTAHVSSSVGPDAVWKAEDVDVGGNQSSALAPPI